MGVLLIHTNLTLEHCHCSWINKAFQDLKGLGYCIRRYPSAEFPVQVNKKRDICYLLRSYLIFKKRNRGQEVDLQEEQDNNLILSCAQYAI